MTIKTPNSNKTQLLNPKVAIITGASRGIGSEIAQVFAENGAKVAIVYKNNIQAAQKIKMKIIKKGQEAEIFQCDITDNFQIDNCLKLITKKFKNIDILVNNAGVLSQIPFEQITDKDYEVTLTTNLKGAFFFTQKTINHLKKSKGIIINISSVGGQIGGSKAVHYALSKAGLISLTKSLSNLYAPLGIRANCISPGQILTDMTKAVFETTDYRNKILPKIPLGRVGQPKDVANVALFLASDLSSYITGQVINVNGGEFLG